MTTLQEAAHNYAVALTGDASSENYKRLKQQYIDGFMGNKSKKK